LTVVIPDRPRHADIIKQVRDAGARTHSIVMRYKTGTVRFVDAIHKYEKKPMLIKR
jgi:fructose-1,6-bisphosphatase II